MLGHSTTIGALIAAVAMVAGVQVIRSASPLPDDASIGVLFVGFLALAVVVMSAQRGRGAGDLTRFLFGSINAVDSGDLRTLLIVTAITLGRGDGAAPGVAGRHVRRHAGGSCSGFRPQLTHFALLVLLALAIVASFETVGSLLVFAFLIAPPATASLLVRRVPLVMVAAVGDRLAECRRRSARQLPPRHRHRRHDGAGDGDRVHRRPARPRR